MNLKKKIALKEKDIVYSNYDHSIKLQKDVLVSNFLNLVDEQRKGAQIRNRAQWIEEGEKCTIFFYNLEKKKIINNTINQLKRKMTLSQLLIPTFWKKNIISIEICTVMKEFLRQI